MADQPDDPGADELDDEVYDMTGVVAEVPSEWSTKATYELEAPVRCPHCRDAIRTVRVVRLVRRQVAFTSTLPRGGRAFVCPLCERLLSIELSGII
jgi:hypothetical protein